MKCNILRVSFAICAVMLIASMAQATKVVVYDGTIGDADPRTQGLTLEVPDGTPVVGPNPAGFTPDSVNDYVTINPVAFTDYAYQLGAGALKTSLEPLVANDKYKITLQTQAGPSTDFTKSEVLDLITGTGTGSSGFRERILLETNLTQPGGPGNGPFNDRYRLILQGGTIDVIGDRFLEVGETPNFTSMHAVNTIELVRDSFQFDVLINGDLIYRGIGNASGIGGFQLEMRDAGLSDYNLSYLSVESIPEPSTVGLGLLGTIALSARCRRKRLS